MRRGSDPIHLPVPPENSDNPLDLTREHALVRAAVDGDQRAFEELFRAHHPRIFRTLLGMLGNEADAHEVGQCSWIKAWQHLDRFNYQSRFITWLHRIAVNAALDELRRRARKRSRFVRLFSRDAGSPPGEPSPQMAGTPCPDPARELQAREIGAEIERALAALPDDQRTVLVLREFDGYSYEEIAGIVGCRVGTVMSRLHLARTKLQARLSKDRP